MVRQRQILDQYQMLVRLRDQMHELQRQYRSSTAFSVDVADLVTVVTDRREIGALSVEMVLSAEQDVASLETEHFSKPPDPKSARTLPAELVARGVRFRNIYSRAVLDIPGADDMLRSSIASGWNCRVYQELPMKMVVVDQRAALVPLGPTGMEGALVVRAPVVVAALRDYFELLWHRAVPAPGNADGGIPREQDQVLRLVLTGMTDAAIARHLDISERTVRRHVGALQERLGATNRVTLAVAAVRDGWLN